MTLLPGTLLFRVDAGVSIVGVKPQASQGGGNKSSENIMRDLKGNVFTMAMVMVPPVSLTDISILER